MVALGSVPTVADDDSCPLITHLKQEISKKSPSAFSVVSV